MNSRAQTQRLWINLSFTLAFLGAIYVLTLHGEVEAQSAAGACGQTLTADTVMVNDLTGCPGGGLILGTSNIRLDCASHTITGSDTGIGIRISSRVGGAAIVNCDVRHFDTGLDIGGTGGHDILHNTVAENGVGIITTGGERPNVFANNVLNNDLNAQIQGDGPNQWDLPGGPGGGVSFTG